MAANMNNNLMGCFYTYSRSFPVDAFWFSTYNDLKEFIGAYFKSPVIVYNRFVLTPIGNGGNDCVGTVVYFSKETLPEEWFNIKEEK